MTTLHDVLSLHEQMQRSEAGRVLLAEVWAEGEAAGRHNVHEFRPGRAMTNPYDDKEQQT